MARMSYEEQFAVIDSRLKKEIDDLKSLPKVEAKKLARKRLMKIGLIDGNGNLTAPYIALRGQYVQ